MQNNDAQSQALPHSPFSTEAKPGKPGDQQRWQSPSQFTAQLLILYIHSAPLTSPAAGMLMSSLPLGWITKANTGLALLALQHTGPRTLPLSRGPQKTHTWNIRKLRTLTQMPKAHRCWQ
eukprot:1157814-Pelagomonas_calceolata.AAC.3